RSVSSSFSVSPPTVSIPSAAPLLVRVRAVLVPCRSLRVESGEGEQFLSVV
ncbi:uncharacterized protein FOMMEDRAFT_137944, partial [Fomitiporia mediterranea MF3/22]|uniref:uncharacterized protein n=1 Tax=Fomitiporia mediterranea (strain MF3/22) TaxID=694068 RepID=UPI0004409449